MDKGSTLNSLDPLPLSITWNDTDEADSARVIWSEGPLALDLRCAHGTLLHHYVHVDDGVILGIWAGEDLHVVEERQREDISQCLPTVLCVVNLPSLPE